MHAVCVCVMWACAIQSIWNMSASHVKVCVCEKQTCSRYCVIVVSHALRTQGMLEALQSEFVSVSWWNELRGSGLCT